MGVLQLIWICKTMGSTLLMCQNTTMRVYGAQIKIYCVQNMFKTYSSSSSLVITSRWFATSRLVAPVSVRLVYCNNTIVNIRYKCVWGGGGGGGGAIVFENANNINTIHIYCILVDKRTSDSLGGSQLSYGFHCNPHPLPEPPRISITKTSYEFGT